MLSILLSHAWSPSIVPCFKNTYPLINTLIILLYMTSTTKLTKSTNMDTFEFPAMAYWYPMLVSAGDTYFPGRTVLGYINYLFFLAFVSSKYLLLMYLVAILDFIEI